MKRQSSVPAFLFLVTWLLIGQTFAQSPPDPGPDPLLPVDSAFDSSRAKPAVLNTALTVLLATLPGIINHSLRGQPELEKQPADDNGKLIVAQNCNDYSSGHLIQALLYQQCT